jgi:four helix bundle protein
MKINSFRDLFAWQEGHKLALTIYSATKHFPREEVFGLTSQIRRASISVTSNIAEGFARNSKKEKAQFYYTALGSLAELKSQLLISKDVGYISNEQFDALESLASHVGKILNGLIRSNRQISKFPPPTS